MLPREVLKKLDKALRFLSENPRHPSLQTRPVLGQPGVYEGRVDKSYRFTYERLPGDVFILRTVGKHDETLRDP